MMRLCIMLYTYRTLLPDNFHLIALVHCGRPTSNAVDRSVRVYPNTFRIYEALIQCQAHSTRFIHEIWGVGL